MGVRNKLLLPIGDVPMIAHMVRTYQTVTDGAVLVVTGHEGDAVSAALDGTGATTVHNPDYASGQASSVACGLRALGPCDAVLIGLGDQPLLTTADLRALIAAHDGTRITIPTNSSDRGNPILVPRHRVPALLDGPTPGCQRFTRTHPDQVHKVPLPAPGFYRDIDTPDDYARFETVMT